MVEQIEELKSNPQSGLGQLSAPHGLPEMPDVCAAGTAKLIEARPRQGVPRLLVEVQLSAEEKAVAEGEVLTLSNVPAT